MSQSEPNNTISILVRFHDQARLPYLEEALLSLARQDWPDFEVIVLLQNGTNELENLALAVLQRHRFPVTSRYRVLPVSVAEGVDGRSALLNCGLKWATGRYVAFLDDDDIVYPQGYRTLIQQSRESGKAVTVGGCQTIHMKGQVGREVIVSAEPPFVMGRTRYDLFRGNFIPINSYILDRKRIDPSDLYFDEALSIHEDYEFLLRLSAKYEFDFTKLETNVCEYRIRLDGVNTIPYNPDAPVEAITAYQQSHLEIEERKKEIICAISIREVVELQREGLKYADEAALLRAQIEALEYAEQRGRLLYAVADKIYEFFSRFPRLEKLLSRFTHSFQRTYKSIKDRKKIVS